MLLDQTIFLKCLFHPAQKIKKSKKGRKEGKREGRKKGNRLEYSNNNSGLKLISYLKGIIITFQVLFLFVTYFRPLLKSQGTKRGFLTLWSLSQLPNMTKQASNKGF